MPGNKRFSQEEVNLIMSMKGNSFADIVKAIKDKFGTERTEKAVYQRIKWVEKLEKEKVTATA